MFPHRGAPSRAEKISLATPPACVNGGCRPGVNARDEARVSSAPASPAACGWLPGEWVVVTPARRADARRAPRGFYKVGGRSPMPWESIPSSSSPTATTALQRADGACGSFRQQPLPPITRSWAARPSRSPAGFPSASTRGGRRSSPRARTARPSSRMSVPLGAQAREIAAWASGRRAFPETVGPLSSRAGGPSLPTLGAIKATLRGCLNLRRRPGDLPPGGAMGRWPTTWAHSVARLHAAAFAGTARSRYMHAQAREPR